MIFHGEAVNSSDLDIGTLFLFFCCNSLHDLIYIEGTENCIIISIYESMFQVIDSFRICHISRADGNADIILSCIYNRCFLRWRKFFNILRISQSFFFSQSFQNTNGSLKMHVVSCGRTTGQHNITAGICICKIICHIVAGFIICLCIRSYTSKKIRAGFYLVIIFIADTSGTKNIIHFFFITGFYNLLNILSIKRNDSAYALQLHCADKIDLVLCRINAAWKIELYRKSLLDI